MFRSNHSIYPNMRLTPGFEPRAVAEGEARMGAELLT